MSLHEHFTFRFTFFILISLSLSATQHCQPTTEIQIDDSIVMQLVCMGFDMEGCRKAVYHTEIQGIERAMNWVLEHMGDPGPTTVIEEADGLITAKGFTRNQAVKTLKSTLSVT